MIFTETYSHATVEEWTEARCRVQDFITHEETGEVYSFWNRQKIATYIFKPTHGAESKDRHLLNNFFLENGVKVKPGTKIMTEGPKIEEEKDKYAIEII